MNKSNDSTQETNDLDTLEEQSISLPEAGELFLHDLREQREPTVAQIMQTLRGHRYK